MPRTVPCPRPIPGAAHPRFTMSRRLRPRVGAWLEATFIDELSRLRQRHTAPLILELDLSEGIAEEPPADPVSAVLAMRRPRLADVLDGLRRARADDKVRALVVKIGGRPIGVARVQELRSAIAAFRRSGKATVAWAETYGEFGPGNAAYYLATAFDRVWLQPSGDVGLTGLSLEQWFLRGTLDKLGLEYEVSKRHEYKTAADRLTEQGFTGPAREALQQLASSLTGQITDAVAERLAIPPAQARELIDNGPYVAEEALELRLVDALGYRDEVYDDVRKSAGPEASPALPGPVPALPGTGRAGQETARTRRGHDRAHLRGRPDPARAQRPRPDVRRGHGLGHGVGGAADRGGRPAGARDRAAGQQPRRLLRGLGHHLARGGQGPPGGHPDRRVHGRRGRLRRLLHRDGGRRDRRAAGHDHRLDRRALRQAGDLRPAGTRRHHHRLGDRGRARGHVLHDAPVQRGRVGEDQFVA